MAKVSRSKSSSSSSVSSPQPTGPVQATTAARTVSPVDQFNEAAQGLLAYKSSPLMSGAMKVLGGDSVLFPSDITNPDKAGNNPKYLRLLAAVLGLDELEKKFVTLEGQKQKDYLERKAKQRKDKMAKVQREKEEKQRQKREQEEEEG